MLSLPQCSALWRLGALRGWTAELGDHGKASVRPCSWQFDFERLKKREFDHTNYRLLSLWGGSPHAFDSMFAWWSEEDRGKRRQDRSIFYDTNGSSIRCKADGNRITWAQKRVYFVRGTRSLRLLTKLCLFVLFFLSSVNLGVLLGLAYVAMFLEEPRIIAWLKALLY